MEDCRALVLKRSLENEDVDSFRRCRSLLQRMGCVLDKWEEAAGVLYPTVARQELSCAEKCLHEAENKLWQLVARQMTVGVNGGPGQNAAVTNHSFDQHQRPLKTQLECVQREVVATRHSPAVSNQLVHVQRRVQVQNAAVQHVDAAQQKLVPISSNQQVVNLLVDWYITLGENGVHLEGMLLNEGHWKTSPIAVRVGPTTVKTASGTTYNIRGEMCLPADENIPDFIYNNFLHGFPNDWKEIIRDWTELVINQRRLGVQQNVDAMQKQDPVHVQKLQGRGTDKQVHGRVIDNDQDKMPPPNRASQSQKRTQREDVMSPRSQSVMERGRNADKARIKNENKSVSPSKRRSSNRVLMKSLTDLSMNSSAVAQSLDMSVDVNCLKKWGAEIIQETSELVLVGHLVSDSHHVIDRNFVSSCIIRRIQADLIETADGEVYRLLGPANSPETKLFAHGFPLRWKDYLKKGQFPVKSTTVNAKTSRRQNACTDKTEKPSQNIAKNSPRNSNVRAAAGEKNSPSSSSVQQQRRASQMIQQLVRHNIKQSQNSTAGSKSNSSLMTKKNDSLNKRKNRSLLPSQSVYPLKKMRTEDYKHNGGAFRSAHNGSEADVSSQSEHSAKQRLKDPSAGKDKKTEGAKSNMQASQQGKTSTIKKSTAQSQLNTTDKYLAGLASDVGSNEFDFNIF